MKIEVENKVEKNLKNDLLEIANRENIKIRTSFNNALEQTYSYEVESNNNKVFQRKILFPKFTDDSELEQSLALLHELGHHFIYKESSNFKNNFLLSNNTISRYYNETLAWKRGQEILEDLGYWKFGTIKFMYKQQKQKYLRTYAPNGSWLSHIFFSIVKSINFAIKVLKLWISCYLALGIALVFSDNNVPIPFLSEKILHVIKDDFYFSVNYIFRTLLITFIIIFIIKVIIKTLFLFDKKNNK